MTYKIGIVKTDITPPVGVFLAGFAERNEPSTGVYHPLRAVATVIDDGTTPLLILAAEWLGFYDQTERMRGRLTEAMGIPAANIVLSGTHTHCGPAVRQMDLFRHGALDEDYITRAIDNMTAAATEAWSSRTDAQLHFGNGHCTVSRCRRKPDPDNPPFMFRNMMPYDDGFVDHDVPVITIRSPQGDLRGVLLSYACHPTSRGGLEIGGDYCCFAMDEVERQHPNAIACFLQGCGGDQKPRPADPNDEVFTPREIDEIREIGDELGAAACATIDDEMDEVTSPVSVTQQMLDLNAEPFDPQLAEQFLANGHDYQQQWARHQLEMIENGTPVEAVVPYELQTIRFGDELAIVTMAAEMDVEHGLRLKRDLAPRFKHVMPLGYTNAVVGYVPVKRQIPERGYEVWDTFQYHRRTGPYVEATEDQIHAAAHAALLQ